jgi:hypothetical protein
MKLRNLKKNRIWHCTYTTDSANVKEQSIFHGLISITDNTKCKYRTAATLYTLDTWFVSGI